MESYFFDRHDAGRQLAKALLAYGGRNDVLVLALPRGGVPVGYEVATALGADFDILIVRKLGVPYHPELAMGAIASGGALYLNPSVIRNAGVSQAQIDQVMATEREELIRRETLYRGTRAPAEINDKTVILVDDGIATGASMHAAVMALRSNRPARIVVAVPVSPAEAAGRFADDADAFISVLSPEDFYAVGQFYTRFDQTSDDEVRELLTRFHGEASS
ncbi:phosphoribosyltransferase [Mangrovitalea sediminis]|uniref:phosphoribosyltransferase n=1 Tax=Mangrovitalea sediminis TaxID=1982043 RepID=UPI000BE546A9|nr:phosphoribosyltransferase [Mangrovitalea sediminis]